MDTFFSSFSKSDTDISGILKIKRWFFFPNGENGRIFLKILEKSDCTQLSTSNIWNNFLNNFVNSIDNFHFYGILPDLYNSDRLKISSTLTVLRIPLPVISLHQACPTLQLSCVFRNSAGFYEAIPGPLFVRI